MARVTPIEPQRLTTLRITIEGPQAGGKSLLADRLVSWFNSEHRFSRALRARKLPDRETEGAEVVELEIIGPFGKTGGEALLPWVKL